MSAPTNISTLEYFGYSFSRHKNSLLVEEQYLSKAIKAVLEDDVSALEICPACQIWNISSSMMHPLLNISTALYWMLCVKNRQIFTFNPINTKAGHPY